MNPRYITKVDKLDNLSNEEKEGLKEVSKRFAFRASDYYLSLINWKDPNDPIKKLIIPDMTELDEWGALDPSEEKKYTIIKGLEHKYHSTVLLLVSGVCGGFCRYCFRKRIFLKGQDSRLDDLSMAFEYIKKHPEITNVLLTGGDPLILSTKRLEDIVKEIKKIDHVQIVRIGAKMLAFNLYRVLKRSPIAGDDFSLQYKREKIVSNCSLQPSQRTYGGCDKSTG